MSTTGRVVLRGLVRQLDGSFGEPADAMFSRLTGGDRQPVRWDHSESVRATPDEHMAWLVATRRFREIVVAAEREREAVRANWRNRFLPGGRERRERATAHCREVLEAAVRDYRPVIEEIERRRTAERLERRRRQEELAREARERAERAERLRKEQGSRYRTVAAKPLWCWVLTSRGGTRAVWIHRHDVQPAFTVSGDRVRGSEEPLTAAALEKQLLDLSKEVRPARLRCHWDQRARTKVMRECTVEDRRGSFDDWWALATTSHWTAPNRIPGDEPTRPSRGSGHGTSHSSYGAGGGFSCVGGF
ncbi:hypothetical protein ACIQAC_29515 [Streptomyces sp. NPDC088387]|uniref:hypothetical protein n=1 Tax=Streptomyces sp. NPDC088387 TaxID=3365859 RepID=UPI00382BC790